MNTKKGFNELTLAKALGLMFKNMKSGRSIYLVFSRNGFHIMVFVIAMSIISNIVLVDMLASAPIIITRVYPIFIVQLIFSVGSIICGLWLFLKGINIIVGDVMIK